MAVNIIQVDKSLLSRLAITEKCNIDCNFLSHFAYFFSISFSISISLGVVKGEKFCAAGLSCGLMSG